MSDAATWPEAAAKFVRDIGASQTRLEDVERFRLMLIETNRRMNLVGDSTLADFWTRHFLDSAQLLALAPEARTWADLGAGAGFPGLVLAILLADAPGTRVHLVESVAKRCRFLAEVVQALGLPAEIHHARAEHLPLQVEVVTARACAPLTRLLAFARPTLKRHTKGLFLKGAEVDTEVAEARKSWRFELAIHPSLSDPRGRVLELTELARVR
ncbi:MAG TPA: 16S rRNA (guanine(527)-N(7))-methyltransferase RsmG [Caulobacteraceae bacterium]|jgi:16S rRNA (guanine527-N7)-methyltransferase